MIGSALSGYCCGVCCIPVRAASFLGSYWGAVSDDCGATPNTYITRLPSFIEEPHWLDEEGNLAVYHEHASLRVEPIEDDGTTYHCIGAAASQFVDGTTYLPSIASYVWVQTNLVPADDMESTSPIGGLALLEVVDTTNTGLESNPAGNPTPTLIGHWVAKDTDGTPMRWDSLDKLCGYNNNGNPSQYTAVGNEHFVLCRQREGLDFGTNSVKEWQVPTSVATSITATEESWPNLERDLAAANRNKWLPIRYDRHAYPHALFGRVEVTTNGGDFTQVDRQTRYGLDNGSRQPDTSKLQWQPRATPEEYTPRQTVNTLPGVNPGDDAFVGITRQMDSLWIIDFAMKGVTANATLGEIADGTDGPFGFDVPPDPNPTFDIRSWHGAYVAAYVSDRSSADGGQGDKIQNEYEVDENSQLRTNVVAGSDNTSTQATEYLYEDPIDFVVDPEWDVDQLTGAPRAVWSVFGQHRFTNDSFTLLGNSPFGEDPRQGSNATFKFFDPRSVTDTHEPQIDGEDTSHFPLDLNDLPANTTLVTASNVRLQGAGTGPFSTTQTVVLAIEDFPLSLAATATTGPPDNDAVDVGQDDTIASQSVSDVGLWNEPAIGQTGSNTRYVVDWIVRAELVDIGSVAATITPGINRTAASFTPFRAPKGRWYANGQPNDTGPLGWHGHVDAITPAT